MNPKHLLTLLAILLLAGCQDSKSNLDAGALRKQEPFFDAIKRKFEAEGGLAGLQGMPDGKLAIVVRLSQTSIVDSEIALLEKLTDVDEFEARNTELGDSVIDVLLHWPSLRSIDLTGTNVTDSGAIRLAELPQLKQLSISKTQVTDEVVKKLRLALKNCKID